MSAWWKSNEVDRTAADEDAREKRRLPQRRSSAGNTLTTQARSPESIANVEALLALLDPTDVHQRLMRAEALRELGHFNEAIATLENIPDEYQAVAGTIATLACSGETRVNPVQS